MSFFVTVTFDLNYAEPAVYLKINDDLRGLDFSKYLSGWRKMNTQLPSNTFVAEFDTKDYARSSEVRDWLKVEIKKIFKKHFVSGNFFIAVGKKWAWSVGQV